MGEQGPIAADLEAAISRQEDGDLDGRQINSLLHLMTQGKRLGFDEKTHRKQWRRYTRMNYFHLCAQLMENKLPEAVTEDVLEHLTRALEKLQVAYGANEWNNLVQKEVTLSMFEQSVKDILLEALGPERFEIIAGVTLQSIDAADRAVIQKRLGKRLQNEVFRHLLLRVISEQWVEYLTRMEALRVSIGMEAYAQRDPLVMYKSRATDLFRNLLADIRMGAISRMFTYRPRRGTEAAVEQQEQVTDTQTKQADKAAASSKTTKKKRRRRRR